MPFHANLQRDMPSVALTDERVITADQMTDGEAVVSQYRGMIRLWQDAQDNWWWRDCQDTSPGDAALVNDTHFDPNRRIRGMSTMDSDATVTNASPNGVLIEFDEPDATRGIERFVFGIDRPFWVTRVYLSSGANNQTDARTINLHY